MANVEDENTSGPVRGGSATATSERGDRGGLIVRPREDDDQIDPAEYARLLDSYDSSFRNIAEGEVVKGTVLKVTASEVDRRRRLQVRRHHRRQRVPRRERRGHGPGGRHRRRAARADRGPRRLRRPLARKSREDEDLGRGREGLRRAQGRHRPRHRADQGRARGGHRRPRVPARQSQIDVRPVRNLDALRGQELRMRVIKVNKKRGNIVLSRKALLEEENAEKKKHTLETLAEGKVLQGRGQEHHRLRRLHRPRRHRRPAAHHRHVVGPRRPSVRALQGERRDRRDRAQVRPGDRARLARPQAAHRRIRGRT